MKHLIDKDAVLAEIKRLIKHSEMVADHNTQITELVSRELDTLYHLISFTNSLEVKEVDLDNELDFVKDAYYYFTSDERSSMMKVARHFFILGLKAQKGE